MKSNEFELSGKISSVRILDMGAVFQVDVSGEENKSVMATVLTEGFEAALSAPEEKKATFFVGVTAAGVLSANKITLG